MSRTYYVVRTGANRFDLRQTRYAAQLAKGREHPHDTMAVHFTAEGWPGLLRFGSGNTPAEAYRRWTHCDGRRRNPKP